MVSDTRAQLFLHIYISLSLRWRYCHIQNVMSRLGNSFDTKYTITRTPPARLSKVEKCRFVFYRLNPFSNLWWWWFHVMRCSLQSCQCVRQHIGGLIRQLQVGCCTSLQSYLSRTTCWFWTVAIPLVIWYWILLISIQAVYVGHCQQLDISRWSDPPSLHDPNRVLRVYYCKIHNNRISLTTLITSD